MTERHWLSELIDDAVDEKAKSAPVIPPQFPERPRNVELVRNEHNEIVRVVERRTRSWDVVRDDSRKFAGLKEVEGED